MGSFIFDDYATYGFSIANDFSQLYYPNELTPEIMDSVVPAKRKASGKIIGESDDGQGQKCPE